MSQVFSENPAYFLLATIGTSLYIIKMILFMVSGDGDTDLDMDGSSDFDGVDGGSNFSLVSTQSILAFLMGTGWIGLAAKREWGQEDLPSLLMATGFGFIMMVFSSFITFKIKKFNSIPKVNLKEAEGKVGRAYTNIPAKGEGVGQIEITVGGKQQIMQAISTGEAIKSFDSVLVTQVDDSGNFHVQKA